MQGTYGRYKELKRRIRDQAASDIQRVLRGCLARARVRTLMESSEGGGGEVSTPLWCIVWSALHAHGLSTAGRGHGAGERRRGLMQ